MEYCGISKKGRKYNIIAYALLTVDALQLLCNPFFGHAFSTEAVVVAGGDYYRLIPYLGQTFHRVADYGILAAVIIIFIVKMIRAPGSIRKGIL